MSWWHWLIVPEQCPSPDPSNCQGGRRKKKKKQTGISIGEQCLQKAICVGISTPLKEETWGVSTLISQSKVVWPWSDASANTNERKDGIARMLVRTAFTGDGGKRLDVEATKALLALTSISSFLLGVYSGELKIWNGTGRVCDTNGCESAGFTHICPLFFFSIRRKTGVCSGIVVNGFIGAVSSPPKFV